MVERLGADAVEPQQPRRDRLRVREDLARFGQPDAVDLRDDLAGPPVFGRGRQVAVRRAVLVVRLAVLVDEPHDLVGVPHGVGRKARRDDGVDRAASRFGQVQAPPGRGSADQIEPLPLDERERHEVGLDAARDELLGQPADVPLGASPRERSLNAEHEDAPRLHRGGLQAVTGARPMSA